MSDNSTTATKSSDSKIDSKTESVSKQSVKKVQPSASKSKQRRKTKAASNILGQIAELVRSDCSKQQFYRQAFRLTAKHFNASYAVLSVRVGAQTLQDEYVDEGRSAEDVMAVVDAMTIEAEADQRANVRLFGKDRDNQSAVLSAPIYAGTGQIGAICLATNNGSSRDARVLLSELISIIAFTGSQTVQHAGDANTSSPNGSAVARALEKASNYESIQELAYSMVNNIAGKFSCDQVAFGLFEKQQARLLAISGLDRFSRSRHGVMQIQQAMEECADAKESIHYQLAGGFGESTGEQSFLLHRHWHTASNNASLLSVPIRTHDEETDGEVLAVVSLQRDSNNPFDESEIDRIRKLLQPFGPVVRLLNRASRTSWTRTKESLTQFSRSLTEPKRWGRKILTGLAAAGVLFFLFGRVPHRVVVSSVVQPNELNHVTAPIQGTLRSVLVKDGDTVTRGQVLATLDARPMELERDRLRAEIAGFAVEVNEALSNRRPADAAIAQTSLASAETQLKIVEGRIDEATIVAPRDGIVLEGDLDQRVGQMLMFGDPLLQIGSRDGLRVELRIPEEQAGYVEVGQEGNFASYAEPGQKLQFNIDRLIPSAQVIDDQNVFVAEASLQERPTWMRAGMEGTSKVRAGWRPTWWVMTHQFVDRIRMALWL